MKKGFVALAIALLSAPLTAKEQIGVSIGSPAVVNLVYKGTIAEQPINISGMYWDNSYHGIEVGYRILEKEELNATVQLLAGYTQIEDFDNTNDKWRYVGASATFSWGGFFIEPGISIGSGDYSNPQGHLQVGYLWEF